MECSILQVKSNREKALIFFGNFSGGFDTDTKKASDSIMAWDPVQGSLLFSKFEFSIKPDLRGFEFF